jgi:hypothetical protein
MTRTARALLVGIGTYISLTALSFFAGEMYVAAWLPLLKLESQWLSLDGLVCDSLTLVTRNAEHLVQLHSITTMNMVFERGSLPAGVAVRSTTLQAYVLSHPVLIYTVLAAWPVREWRQRIALLLLGVPCVLITTTLDIPFVLSGLMRRLIFTNFAPARVDEDPLVLYSEFMHGGGRLGLAVVAALVTALCVTRARRSNLLAHIGQLAEQTSRPLNTVATKTSPR